MSVVFTPQRRKLSASTSSSGWGQTGILGPERASS